MEEKVKLLAFHLPQFHTFPENDEWWGKGFTEWVNVKKAVPLFEGHNQPRVPQDKYYYDLSKDEDIQRQVDLAIKYGLDGFCFYHYWFDGKLLLEKPVEKFKTLERKLPYCLCWANEPWTRSWDGNVKDVIMPQYYGGEREWEEHFVYLLPFFQDEYYIKKDNKPMMVLYRTNNIPDCDKMISYWHKRCMDEGFDGIYLVEEMNAFQKEAFCANSDAVIEFEPMNALKKRTFIRKSMDLLKSKCHNIKNRTKLTICNYDQIWKQILSTKYKNEKQVYLGGFVDWDNTARKGKNGLVFKGASPEKFKKYLRLQIERAKKVNSEFIFLNAWNEWGEGTYLEPDEKYGTAYLEAISSLENRKG